MDANVAGSSLTVPMYLLPPKRSTKAKRESSSLSKLDSIKARETLRNADMRNSSGADADAYVCVYLF